MNIEKTIANTLKESIGSNPKVFRYHNESENKYIDIFSATDTNAKDIINIATIGLYKKSIAHIDGDKILCAELVSSVNKDEAEIFSQVLSTCCFDAMENKFDLYLGNVCQNVINSYMDSDMKHIYFTNPIYTNLKTLHIEKGAIAWLMAIAISDAEYAYLKENGIEKFDNALASKNVDFTNLKRKSIF